MTTRPRPDERQYEAALQRIHQRRRNAGDDHPLALSEDPREVLAYLRRRGRAGLVIDDTGDDIVDALILRMWLRWEGDEIELWLLEASEHLGRHRRTVGSVLGLDSGQGLIDLIKRLRIAFGKTRPVTVPMPAPALVTTPVALAAAERDARIRALAADLLARREQMPLDIADDVFVEMLEEELDQWPPGTPPPSERTVPAIRLLLGDLADVIVPGSPLRAVVDQGVQLVGVRAASDEAR